MKDKNNDIEKLGWLKNHIDTIIVISTILAGLLWMSGKFNDIKKDVGIIKTVLVMKNSTI